MLLKCDVNFMWDIVWNSSSWNNCVWLVYETWTSLTQVRKLRHRKVNTIWQRWSHYPRLSFPSSLQIFSFSNLEVPSCHMVEIHLGLVDSKQNIEVICLWGNVAKNWADLEVLPQWTCRENPHFWLTSCLKSWENLWSQGTSWGFVIKDGCFKSLQSW